MFAAVPFILCASLSFLETSASRRTSFRRNPARAPLPPTFASKETNFTATVGALDVKLLCRVDATTKSKTRYRWTRNGITIRKTRKYRLKKYRYLRIKKVNVSDAGDYVCWAKNKDGEIKRTITLVVFDRRSSNGAQAPLPPTFASKKTNFTAAVGALDVKLLCRVDVTKKSKSGYWWTRNGVPIRKSRKYRLKKYRYLRIRNVNVSDAGDYVCRAKNKEGEVKRTITLVVFDRRSSNSAQDVKPYFTEKRKMTRDYLLYPAGHRVKLVCSADGFPVPTVVWYKDGKQLKYIPGEQTPLSRHDFEITLQSLKPKDTGQYNCNVSNRAGSIGMTYEVIVKEMMITRPVLQSRVENITAYEGDTVTITCKTVSDGLPHFQWVAVNPRKNNSIEVLGPGLSQEDYVLDADNTRWHGVKLRLTNVTRADEKDYFCVVGDNRGYEKQEFRLRVLPKSVQTTQRTPTPAPAPPAFTTLRPRGFLEFPKSYHVDVGKVVHMKCDIVNRGKNDMTLEWFKNGKLIRSRRHFATEWITRNSLTISDAKKEDAGGYKCRISSALGSASWEFKLSVGET